MDASQRADNRTMVGKPSLEIRR